MRPGDLVKILDESRSPTDKRLIGTVIDINWNKKCTPDTMVEVMWQFGRITKIRINRLERINENDMSTARKKAT